MTRWAEPDSDRASVRAAVLPKFSQVEAVQDVNHDHDDLVKREIYGHPQCQ